MVYCAGKLIENLKLSYKSNERYFLWVYGVITHLGSRVLPRSISHKPQEARFKCNILRSMSHIPKQACFKCNIPRSISHIPNQAPFNYNIPRSTSHKEQEAPFKCNISRSILAINHKKRASTVMFLATSLSSKKTTRARSALSNRPHFLWDARFVCAQNMYC